MSGAVEALGGVFTGTWDEARKTYTIGSAEDVLGGLHKQAAAIDRVDSYILTPLSDELEQLDALAERVVPELRAAA